MNKNVKICSPKLFHHFSGWILKEADRRSSWGCFQCVTKLDIFFLTNKNSVIVTSCLSKYEVTILDFYSQLEGYKKGCKWSWLLLAQALSYLPVPNSFFWVSHCGTLWLFWNKNLTRMLFLQGWYICRKKFYKWTNMPLNSRKIIKKRELK